MLQTEAEQLCSTVSALDSSLLTASVVTRVSGTQHPSDHLLKVEEHSRRRTWQTPQSLPLTSAPSGRASRDDHPGVPAGSVHCHRSCRLLVGQLVGAAMLHPERRAEIPHSRTLHAEPLLLQCTPRCRQHALHFSQCGRKRKAFWATFLSDCEFRWDFSHNQRHVEHGRSEHGPLGGRGVSSQLLQQDALQGRSPDRRVLVDALPELFSDPAADGLGRIQPHVRLVYCSPGPGGSVTAESLHDLHRAVPPQHLWTLSFHPVLWLPEGSQSGQVSL